MSKNKPEMPSITELTKTDILGGYTEGITRRDPSPVIRVGDTTMGVAIAETPEGPYQKFSENPVIDGGHEVCVWPTDGGVASLQCATGAAGNTLQFAADGINFEKLADVVPPKAPGPFRQDNFEDNVDMTLNWGVCMQPHKQWPWLMRFDVVPT